jgi:hypothetical protein
MTPLCIREHKGWGVESFKSGLNKLYFSVI